MMRNEICIPKSIRRGHILTPCPFHRECEALSKGRGLGFCDFDGSQTICDGDRSFCTKLDALREYFLKIGKDEEVNESEEEAGEIALKTETETVDLRDNRSKKQDPGVSVILPLEFRTRNDPSPHAGVSGTLDEKGLLVYSVYGDLCISQELAIRVFFPNGYELDSFRMIAAVTSKKDHVEADWKGCKYGLKVIHIPRADRQKMRLLLRKAMTDHTLNNGSDQGASA